MKKIISICLLFVLLLTSCANVNPQLDVTTTIISCSEDPLTPTMDVTTTFGENETTTPKEETTVQQQEQPPRVAPLFVNEVSTTVKDLHTLLIERSDNISDYEEMHYADEEHFEQIVNSVPGVNILITLEDLNLTNVWINRCMSVSVYVKNSFYDNEDLYLYLYAFEDALIEVFYAPEYFSPNDANGFNYYSNDLNIQLPWREGGISAFLENSDVGCFYVEKLEDCLVAYLSNGLYYMVYILTDDFRVQISFDPKRVSLRSEIGQYFSEETYRDAILQLVEGIENRE